MNIQAKIAAAKTDVMENLRNSDKADSWKMFDRIAPRYDLLNRLLSFGQDIYWRNKTAAFLPDNDNIKLLDLATGTGDLLLTLMKDKRVVSGTGLDMAREMLAHAQLKINNSKIKKPMTLLRGDAVNIPLNDNSFEAVTIAFGIRNVPDVSKTLKEMHRILKPKGRALILEFSLPKSALMKTLYLFYFRNILPLVGSLISGDSYAYKYLNKTVESFPYGQDFCELMEQAGFKMVRERQMTFGIATIYCGDK